MEMVDGKRIPERGRAAAGERSPFSGSNVSRFISPVLSGKRGKSGRRLMWLWGFHSGWIGVPCGSLSGLAVSDGGFFQEGNPVGKRKKSGRCREGACRIEWEKDEERTGVGVLRCQIDPQLQIHRLEARILTYKQAEVARRGEPSPRFIIGISWRTRPGLRSTPAACDLSGSARKPGSAPNSLAHIARITNTCAISWQSS